MQEFILKNLISIIIILIFVFAFLKGTREGFAKMLLSFCSLIITLVLTKTFTPVVANIVKDYTNIEATLSDMIYKILIKSDVYDKINLSGFDKIFSTNSIGDVLKNGLCVNIANVMINLACGIALFIIIIVGIKIIIKILDFIDYIPVIGKINRFLGGALGVVEICIMIWVIFTVFRVMENVPQIGIIVENIRASKIANFLYENNKVFDFLSNLFSIKENL